ncbi:hypothetical protein DNX69_15625 [Rhodopseudomonas palustris]|uniref:Uncharacterized protein n=1 Tax=Rhodopseudomonas palustris TaxID=1076 RepID=A0A323UDI4_RHOPL|nr:hypothetical protein DNX69_15625 [Rhodopseudomonas palustris]
MFSDAVLKEIGFVAQLYEDGRCAKFDAVISALMMKAAGVDIRLNAAEVLHRGAPPLHSRRLSKWLILKDFFAIPN